MTTVDRHLVRRIFTEALELPPVDRVDFIEKSAAGDARVRDKVLSLLSALKDAGDFLGSPTEALSSSPAADAQADTLIKSVSFEGPGTRIGNYKLLQQIGEGGFGSVFMAEQQQPVVRRVALKIIKLGMDTRQVIARFEAERQALAMMDHPNIARVLDAGATETGRPYFVMELVRGDPITEYCDAHNLSTNQRLELFASVCQAVQHAHHKGIIHRDLKPSNVLIALHDGVPVPKVIDFGIAKATSARLTEKTLFTEFRQFIGTPEYMSPEQAGGSSIDVDTRSDVYSLGVLLYELLTGTTPFDSKQLRSAAFNEIQRIIREVEPQKPSTRVSTLGETANTIAAKRHTEPGKLSRTIRGDLDWIVMRCLEKDRTRRYESAHDLSRDIQRYMAHQPVDATPPGMVYRSQKFLRRHRAAVVVAGAIAAALILGLVTTTIGLVMAQRERDLAQTARQNEEAARIAADEQRDRADQNSEQLRQQLYISQINRAQHLIETGGSEPVKPILASCDPALRNWEWERLNWLADRSVRTVHVHDAVNGASHNTVSYSADGTRLLTIGDLNRVRIWDAESFAMIREIVLPEGNEVTCAAFSPDSTLIAVGTGQQVIRVHRAATGELVREFKPDFGWVRGVAISPDNSLIAGGTWFESTIVWDMATGNRVHAFPGQHGRGEAVQFTRDGSRLMIGSLGNDVSMIDMTTGTPVWTERGAGFVVFDAAISPDETKIASIGQDSRLWMRDARTGRLIYSIATGKGAIYSLAFHPDGDYLAVVGSDGLATLFDCVNGENLGSLGGHESALLGVAFHANGRWMLTMDVHGNVKHWHLGVRQALGVHRTSNTINCARFSADHSLIYLGPTEDGFHVLDALTLETLVTTREPITVVADLRVSGNGTAVLAWGDPTKSVGHRVAALYDRMGKVISHWPCDGGIAGFSPDTSLLASHDEPGVLNIRNAGTGEVQSRLTLPSDCNGRMFFVEAQTIVVGCTGGRISVHDAKTGEVQRELKVHDKPFDLLAINPQHDLMITTVGDDALHVWKWSTGELRMKLSDAGQPTTVAVSPDGRRIIAGGNAMTVLMWDVQTGRRIMTIGKTTGGMGTVAYSPDGSSILATSGDHALRVWDTQMPTLANLDNRYEVDVERRKIRRELLEFGREWRP